MKSERSNSPNFLFAFFSNLWNAADTRGLAYVSAITLAPNTSPQNTGKYDRRKNDSRITFRHEMYCVRDVSRADMTAMKKRNAKLSWRNCNCQQIINCDDCAIFKFFSHKLFAEIYASRNEIASQTWLALYTRVECFHPTLSSSSHQLKIFIMLRVNRIKKF